MVRAPVFMIAAFGLVALVSARPEFRDILPNGKAADSPSSGISCKHLGHMGCVAGAERNQFGKDFKAAGLKWTKDLCKRDSDGDGISNGREMGDPCCMWSPSNRNPPGFRVTNLSHPGNSDETGSINAPGCPSDMSDDEKPSAPLPKKEKAKMGENKMDENEEGKKVQKKVEGMKAGKGMKKPVVISVAPKTGKGGNVTSCLNAKCSKSGSGDYDGKACCIGHECIPAPWEGPSDYRCLPLPPKCYQSDQRCAGAPGKPYVPYANCCNNSEVCLPGQTDWGSFCKPRPANYVSPRDTTYKAPVAAAPSAVEPPKAGAPVEGGSTDPDAALFGSDEFGSDGDFADDEYDGGASTSSGSGGETPK